jgi:hypothetical protein
VILKSLRSTAEAGAGNAKHLRIARAPSRSGTATVLHGHATTSRIATYAVSIPAKHIFANPDIPVCRQPVTMEGITIRDNVWICCNVPILDADTSGVGPSYRP